MRMSHMKSEESLINFSCKCSSYFAFFHVLQGCYFTVNKTIFNKMSAEDLGRVQKIKIVLNPDAETPEEFLTFSTEYISLADYRGNLPLSSLKYLEFLELCTQPQTDEEKNSVLLDFKNKLKSVSQNENFCVFDVLCLYAVYYIYESSSASLSAVSRSLYAWYKLDDLVSHGYKSRNSMIYHDNDSFIAELRQFTDLYTNSEGLKVLVFAWFESIMSGNLALVRFLLKFGLIEFECNERSIQLLSMVLKKFKENTEVTISANLQELALRMKRSKFTYRRCLLTFITIVLIAEYKMFEWAATEFGEVVYEELKWKSIPKLRCLDVLMSATTETKITFKDIKYFISKVLNPFRNPGFSMNDFLETFRKMSSEVNENYNPRSLKDLARCKIRVCLQNPVMLPEQVQKLTVPDPLKNFLLYHSEGIWDLLVQSHVHAKFISDV